MNKAARAGAFTLIEMLVALTLVCVLSVAAFVSLRIAFKARDSAEKRLSLRFKADTALALIHRDLLECPVPGGELARSFYGAKDETYDGDYGRFTLELHARSPRLKKSVPYGGVIKTTYLVVDEDGDSRLVRQTISNLLATTEPEPEEEIICRGALGFEIEFYDGSDWVEIYDSSTTDNALPAAVKVTLTLHDEMDNVDREFSRVTVLPCATKAEAGSAVLNR